MASVSQPWLMRFRPAEDANWSMPRDRSAPSSFHSERVASRPLPTAPMASNSTDDCPIPSFAAQARSSSSAAMRPSVTLNLDSVKPTLVNVVVTFTVHESGASSYSVTTSRP